MEANTKLEFYDYDRGSLPCCILIYISINMLALKRILFAVETNITQRVIKINMAKEDGRAQKED